MPAEMLCDTPCEGWAWGSEGVEPSAMQQFTNACRLPVAVAGALMPDAHHGYGLPIGGVLATEGCVIPYAVGMDIACRMRLTVLDLDPLWLTMRQGELAEALAAETYFGMGVTHDQDRWHPVMDDPAWDQTATLRGLKDLADSQIGTSGSGNHFVEFGLLQVARGADGLDLGAGEYLALLSHGGSRGTGAKIAQHYSRIAQELHPELPDWQRELAWLDLDSEAGQEYWLAMELMGRYAAANHELIHDHLMGRLNAYALGGVENHHNFAWRESHQGRDLIVHRKGATPAGRGELGVIPGSMATPGYVVQGLGEARSLNSASHGAGRRMSRNQARKQFNWDEIHRQLQTRHVRLISGDIDEAPDSYKDIDQVMEAQRDLVEPLARFEPRLVKMAPARGEK